MKQAVDKARALVEAHQYIRRFQGKTVVVKVGGSIMDQPKTLGQLLGDICFMATVGMRPVIVHGGGKAITTAMEAAGLEAQFVQGRRYTDERTLAIAEHVLVNEVNQTIVDHVAEAGHKAMGLHSLASCVVFARRLFLTDNGQPAIANDANGQSNGQRRIDIGLVGQVDWVNANLVNALIEANYVPVIAPIARDGAGGKLNVNADSVAGHVAAALQAEKLVLVSDTHGIRTRPDDPESRVSHLDRAGIDRLIQQDVILAGMLPKVEAALVALEAGVAKAHIIDGAVSHSLLLEIYTDKGIGTEIVL